MTKEQLTHYIQISFIEESHKQKLVSSLGEGVPLSDVQRIFEDFLIEKINVQGDGYEKALGNFDALATELDTEIKSQEMMLEKALDEKLVQVNKNDYDARNAVWDQYYADIDKLNAGYEKRLKSIMTKIVAKA